MDFAIVDIETTGGKPSIHHMTEIAIVISDGQRIKERFSSLVHTHQEIPIFIQRLTGINNQMLEGAPSFEELAPKILQMLQGKVFVAHNVNFDYKFIAHHLEMHGYCLSMKKICTVRLSRKIIPGLRSYSLGRLCQNIGIEVENRHRALGDAEATAKLLHLLIQNDKEKHINRHIRSGQREFTLPPNLDKSEYESLPEKPGVYYMLDERSRPLYVGMARNIRKRIASHFGSSFGSKNYHTLYSRIHHISFTETGNELIAALLESYEIKKHQAPFNRSQRKGQKVYNLLTYTDRGGWLRTVIEKGYRQREALATFNTEVAARNFLFTLSEKYSLCPQKLFLVKGRGNCQEIGIGACKGACEGKESFETHNQRLREALSSVQLEQKSQLIIGAGRNMNEKSIIACKNGQYLGFGFVESSQAVTSFDEALSFIRTYPADTDVQNILHAFLSRPKSGYEIINLESESGVLH